jgi:hypothetical protein
MNTFFSYLAAVPITRDTAANVNITHTAVRVLLRATPTATRDLGLYEGPAPISHRGIRTYVQGSSDFCAAALNYLLDLETSDCKVSVVHDLFVYLF